MHIHILTKAWGQSDWNTHTVQHRGTHVSMLVCKWGEADVQSWADITTCTDAYTHSEQGVGPQRG